MPYTSVRDIELIETGSLGKEVLSNDAFTNLAHGISGTATLVLSSADHTLSPTEGLAFVLILTGALTANVNVIVPAESRVYVVDNRTTGAFTVTCRPAAGGGVAVDQSARTLIYCDGTNVYPVASGTGGGGGSGAPTDASYVVGASHALLSGERVVTNTTTVTWDLATAGQAKALIPPDAITYSLIQNVTPTRLLGRFTAGAGDVQEISPGTGLTLDASGVLSATAVGQPLDATLTALAGLATGANQLPYSTGTDTFTQTPLTAFARTVLDDADAATVRGTISAQASDAILTALAGVTTGADTLPFFTGVDTASTTTLTAFMRGLLDDPDLATAQATLGITSVAPYTDEQAQDAVGAMLQATATIALAYADATPALSASVIDGSITEAKLSLSDVTTKDASTTAHGLLRKLSGTATQYLNGLGAWTTPAGGGGESFWEHSPASSLLTGLLAFWRMEESTGTRVDSVASLALTLQGNTAQITTAAGKTGTALRFLGGAGAYLSIADNATLSVGTSSFTLGCWLYFDGTPASGWGLVGKGDVNVSNNGAEYLFWVNGTAFEFVVGSGSSHVARTYPGVTPTTGAWYFLVGWYDAALDTQYFQVNNGSVVSAANTAGSFDSTAAFEIGRQVGWAGSPTVNMRVDNLFFYTRILSDAERAEHWNGGGGLDYPLSVAPTLFPATLTDHVGIGTESATEWLAVAGAIKVGNSLGTENGTIRWNGIDLEGRADGAWKTLTGKDNGTMAQQDAGAVAITGGSATLADLGVDGNTLVVDEVNHRVGIGIFTPTVPLHVAANAYIVGKLSIGSRVLGYPALAEIVWPGLTQAGLTLQIDGTDTPSQSTVAFRNSAAALIGSITQTSTITAYNTSSDARLKHAITPLTGALAVVQALKPIAHRWRVDDSPGVGFLAHEVAEIVDGVVTGEKDQVDDKGNIVPQQIDLSKLVPWLVSCCQELAQQVQTLTARLDAVGG